MKLFSLFGNIEYEGSDLLGTFDSLEKAIEGRKEFRVKYLETHKTEPFDLYSVYEHTLNDLSNNPFLNKPVDTFSPHKSANIKGFLPAW